MFRLGSLHVEIFAAPVQTIVRVIPVRLLVPSPLGVVEICLCARLEIVALGSLILIRLRVHRTVRVQLVVNVVGLSRNRIWKHLVRFEDLLENLLTLCLLFVVQVWLKVGMILLGGLVIGKFDLFLGGWSFDVQNLIQCLFFLSHVKYETVCEVWRSELSFWTVPKKSLAPLHCIVFLHEKNLKSLHLFGLSCLSFF